MTEDKKNQLDANKRIAKLTIIVTILAVMGFAWLAGGLVLLGIAGMILAVAIGVAACKEIADGDEERMEGMVSRASIDARVKEVVDRDFLIKLDVPCRGEVDFLEDRVSRLEAASGKSQ